MGSAVMSSGIRNLLKLVAGWCVALGAGAFTMIYYDEVRTALGMKLEPADFGITAEAARPEAGPEPKVIVKYKYIERPQGASATADAGAPRRRDSWTPSAVLTRHGRHFETTAFINGRAVDVMVDTGASDVALSWEDAQRAGLSISPNSFTRKTHTANGITSFAPVVLDDVRIGDIVVRNVSAAVLQPGKLHKSLLGMSFLGRTRMQMQGNRMVLEQ